MASLITLKGAAAIWYNEVKALITSWQTFEYAFLNKFASATKRNTWYAAYKNIKQAGRPVDDYAIQFQDALRKVDRYQNTPKESIVNDFIAGLNPSLSVMVYAFAPDTLEAAITKAKMVEQGQKNATTALTANNTIAQLTYQNQVLMAQQQQQQKPVEKPKSQNFGKPQQN